MLIAIWTLGHTEILGHILVDSKIFIEQSCTVSHIVELPVPSCSVPYLSLTRPLPVPYPSLTRPLPVPYLSLTYPIPAPHLSLTCPLPVPYSSSLPRPL